MRRKEECGAGCVYSCVYSWANVEAVDEFLKIT